jgi:hypothetical protein
MMLPTPIVDFLLLRAAACVVVVVVNAREHSLSWQNRGVQLRIQRIQLHGQLRMPLAMAMESRIAFRG